MKENRAYLKIEEELCTLPVRPQRSNKGTFGRVLCLCGSEGMAGAAYFAAKAAYRVGAGLLEILTPRSNRPVLQTLLPEAIVIGYEESDWEPLLSSALERADALIMGCGLGTSPLSHRMLTYALRHAALPMVVDADGLNLISGHPVLLRSLKGAVITPHPMEMSRLCGQTVEEILEDPMACAARFAEKYGAVCVLKDHETAVAAGNGLRYRNTTGNSGMATGGSGDVLAGMIGGLLAQWRHGEKTPFQTAAIAVYLHGKSGDLAAERLSEYALMASDLLDEIPQVMKQVEIKNKA